MGLEALQLIPDVINWQHRQPLGQAGEGAEQRRLVLMARVIADILKAFDTRRNR